MTAPITVLAAALIGIATHTTAQDQTRSSIDRLQAVWGLTLDPQVANGVLLATEYGLLRATPDGMAELVADVPISAIGLAASPNDALRLFLSGITASGAPAGMLNSVDGGATWANLPGADGAVKGAVSLTSLSVSRLDDQTMAGLDDQIQLSRDGGQTWKPSVTTPTQTFAVALSGISANRLFAATLSGLMISEDGGATWEPSNSAQAPTTAVASLSGGRVAAFVFGVGVILADEATLDWQIVNAGFEDRFLRGLEEDPLSPGKLYGIADTGAILISRDSGSNWVSFEGNDTANPATIAAGAVLYEDTCQVCHGVGGIGENPDDPNAQDEFGFKAPALNDDTHAWHHSDIGLRATIMQGSARNERMVAFETILSDEEIGSILAYVKSTWSVRSLACQGARHMICMRN